MKLKFFPIFSLILMLTQIACRTPKLEQVSRAQAANSVDVVIGTFPTELKGNTALAAMPSRFSYYDCKMVPEASGYLEGGPEVVYELKITAPGLLNATLKEGANVDVDVHLLSSLERADGDRAPACITRSNLAISAQIEVPGTYYLVVDTWESEAFAGPYQLSVDFQENPSSRGLAAQEQPQDSGLAQADFTLMVVSDINLSYGSESYNSYLAETVSYIKARNPSLVLLTGDLVAGQQQSLNNHDAMWAKFRQSFLLPLSQAQIPVAATPGNHDYAPGFAKDQAAYLKFWLTNKMKVNYVNEEFYPKYFSFSHQGALFISLFASGLTSVDVDWLEAELAANSHLNPKIVFGHLPIYPVAEAKKTEVLKIQNLHKVLTDHEVDVYLAGHHHTFYPGWTQGLRQAVSGCLNGKRAFIGETQLQPVAITEIQVRDGKITYLEGRDVSQNFSVIPRANLPKKILTLTRDDLVDLP